jgi:hypothetical protein
MDRSRSKKRSRQGFKIKLLNIKLLLDKNRQENTSFPSNFRFNRKEFILFYMKPEGAMKIFLINTRCSYLGLNLSILVKNILNLGRETVPIRAIFDFGHIIREEII